MLTTSYISEDNVKEVLDSADKALHECFDMLTQFRHVKKDFNKAILQFQPLLAETLFNLMEFYNKLSHEKRILIDSKSNLPKEKFSKEMARNGCFMKAIRSAIEIGKSMGDAFAWFFYRDNRDELEKHFEHEGTGLYVGGIGGRGELEFIKKSLMIDGCYVLYHGITNMLRIGDFSLYDFHHGIVGLGELKTRKEGNKLQISGVISAKAPIHNPNDSERKQGSFEEQLAGLKKDFPTIERQIRTQTDFLETKKINASATFRSSYEYDMLNLLTPQNLFSLSTDKSLMLLATWSKYKTLYKVLTEKEDFPGLPAGKFTEVAESMIVSELPYNQFNIGRLTTAVTVLSIPILWWDIDEQICKDIYFRRVEITTIFNPAKLLNCFVEDGFSITELGELNKIKLEKRIGDKRISFGNFSSVCFLITNSLMKTHDAYLSVKHVLDETEKGKFPLGSRIDMHIHLDNFGKQITDIEKRSAFDGKESPDGQAENADAEQG